MPGLTAEQMRSLEAELAERVAAGEITAEEAAEQKQRIVDAAADGLIAIEDESTVTTVATVTAPPNLPARRGEGELPGEFREAILQAVRTIVAVLPEGVSLELRFDSNRSVHVNQATGDVYVDPGRLDIDLLAEAEVPVAKWQTAAVTVAGKVVWRDDDFDLVLLDMTPTHWRHIPDERWWP